jgi:hypothetical protein
MSDPIARVEAVLEAATPGPWTVRGQTIRYARDREVLADHNVPVGDVARVNATGRYGVWEQDAAFIALARNLMPDALAVVRAAAEYDASIIEAERLAIESMTCTCVTESGECEHDLAYYAANDERRSALEANRAALSAFTERVQSALGEEGS